MYYYGCPNCHDPRVVEPDKSKKCISCNFDMAYRKPALITRLPLSKEDQKAAKIKAFGFLHLVPQGTHSYFITISELLVVGALVRPRSFDILHYSDDRAGRTTIPFKTPWCLIWGTVVNGLDYGRMHMVVKNVREPNGELNDLAAMRFSPLPIGNVKVDGTICWGAGNSAPRNLKDAYGQFFTSPFNFHWTNYRSMFSWRPITAPVMLPTQNKDNTTQTVDGLTYCTICNSCRCHECVCFPDKVAGSANDLCHMWLLANYKNLPQVRVLGFTDTTGVNINFEQQCMTEAIFLTENPEIIKFSETKIPHPSNRTSRSITSGAAVCQTDGTWLVRFKNNKLLSYNPVNDTFFFLGSRRVRRKLHTLQEIKFPSVKV